MGYRSSVAICLTEQGYTTFTELYSNMSGDGNDQRKQVESLLAMANKYNCPVTKSVLFVWDAIKWYPTIDTGVMELEECITRLPTSEYLFMQIGESLDDVEQRGDYRNNPWNVHIARNIIFDTEVSNPES